MKPKLIENHHSFRAIKHWCLLLQLGFKDLSHEWRMSSALMLSIVSIVAPLLLLFGLKTGVLETMREILLKDPRNLEIIIFENTHLSRDWFTRLSANPKLVRFVIPRTRTLNTIIDVENKNNYLLKHVEIIPTGPGDPLLPSGLALPTRPTEILLSHAAGVQLTVSKGEKINVWLKRTLAGVEQRVALELTVIGIVPEVSFGRPALFTTLEFLEALEDYKDGYSAPALSGKPNTSSLQPLSSPFVSDILVNGQDESQFDKDFLKQADKFIAPNLIANWFKSFPDKTLNRIGVLAGKTRTYERTSYASARLYAQKPEDVGPLADRLRASGLEVRTRSEDLARLEAADQLLSRVLSLIAAISLVGGYLAFGGAIWISIERKRTTIALLRLIGLRSGDIIYFCLCQTVQLGIAAFAAAYSLFYLGAIMLNRYGLSMFIELLGTNTSAGLLCRLRLEDVAIAAIVTLGFTLFASLIGVLHAKSFQPAESLREI